jgi:hypothetical protein
MADDHTGQKYYNVIDHISQYIIIKYFIKIAGISNNLKYK